VVVAAERGIGNGSDAWDGTQTTAGCGLTYDGQPNAANGIGASGGDVDVAIGSAPVGGGMYPVYLVSNNAASVAVARSTDGGHRYQDVVLAGGVHPDDRPWIAAYGARTVLVSYHDVSSSQIEVLRSDDGGVTFPHRSEAIDPSSQQAAANEIGNLVIDRRNPPPGASPGHFWAYQAYVGPSDAVPTDTGAFNEAFVAVSDDGGATWTDRGIPCSTTATAGQNGLDHNFPNVSVSPAGTLWATWSDDKDVRAATSSDHGRTWACSAPVDTKSHQAIFPWIVAGAAGVDLVYYATPTATNQTWSVFFAQDLAATPTGWGPPQRLGAVHAGPVCEDGTSCVGDRQLFDDFGVDVDPRGMAHVAYSQDAPALGDAGSSIGYAVQTAGAGIGANN
jgi:hypothetical protein